MGLNSRLRTDNKIRNTCIAYGDGSTMHRTVQEVEPRGEKAQLRMKRTADVRIVAAGGGKMSRQLGKRDPQHQDNRERYHIGERCQDTRARCRKLNRKKESDGRRNVSDRLHQDGRKTQCLVPEMTTGVCAGCLEGVRSQK